MSSGASALNGLVLINRRPGELTLSGSIAQHLRYIQQTVSYRHQRDTVVNKMKLPRLIIFCYYYVIVVVLIVEADAAAEDQLEFPISIDVKDRQVKNLASFAANQVLIQQQQKPGGIKKATPQDVKVFSASSTAPKDGSRSESDPNNNNNILKYKLKIAFKIEGSPDEWTCEVVVDDGPFLTRFQCKWKSPAVLEEEQEIDGISAQDHYLNSKSPSYSIHHSNNNQLISFFVLMTTFCCASLF